MNESEWMSAVIGSKIKNLREERKFDATKVAKEAGIDFIRYNSIESGKCMPSIINLLKIARALNTTLEQLLKDIK